MRWSTSLFLAFLSGFAVMVLEIVGTRHLAKHFGSSFYTWTSQIGVVLVALTLGYLVGGYCADRSRRLQPLVWMLLPAGIFTALIPEFADRVMELIVQRHPPDQEISAVWRKVDPAMGGALVFLPPCFVLAAVPPYLLRMTTRTLDHVGRVGGTLYGAGSLGSIVGVFVSGYLLIDLLPLSQIFRATGLAILALGVLCWICDKPYDDQ